MARVVLLAFVLAASLGAPAAAAGGDDRGGGYLVARVASGGVVLHARPFGRALERVGPRTEFGSPQTLSVVRSRDGRWLGVVSSALPNGRVAWIDARTPSLRVARVRIRLEVDLSRRRLSVHSGSAVVRTFPVAVGRPGSSTPVGRFAVTDKLDGSRFGPYYGCCILALSGHQPHTPAGWRGGSRLAIHGTPTPGDIGTAASAGCLHASAGDLRFLMRLVPLGTPVVIHP